MIYLASRSPRRQELLKQIGIEFQTLDVAINEDWDGREPAADYVLRLAREKAETAWNGLSDSEHRPVLAADTSVVLDDEILGKPEDEAHALAMMQKLSGRTHRVYTGVALCNGETRTALSVSQVAFRPLTADQCRAYWQSGEPQGKAGGYAIQGYAARYIQRLEGSYSGVMGLPLYETAALLDSLNA